MIRVSNKRNEVILGIQAGYDNTEILRKHLGLTKATLTCRVAYLEENGLVEVTRNGNKPNQFKLIEGVRYEVTDERVHRKRGKWVSPWPQPEYPALDFALRVM